MLMRLFRINCMLFLPCMHRSAAQIRTRNLGAHPVRTPKSRRHWIGVYITRTRALPCISCRSTVLVIWRLLIRQRFHTANCCFARLPLSFLQQLRIRLQLSTCLLNQCPALRSRFHEILQSWEGQVVLCGVNKVIIAHGKRHEGYIRVSPVGNQISRRQK